MSESALGPVRLLARTLAHDLDRRFAHVLEPGMRECLLAEALSPLSAEEACALIDEVEQRPPETRSTLHDPLREALHAWLANGDPERGLTYERRRDLYAAAREQGWEAAAALLRSTPLPDEERPRLPRELVEIPLGRRRSLAHGDDTRLLELLSRDLDPVVIQHVLRNARTRESDVIRMAAATPNLPSTLEEIGRSEHARRSIRVRTAVARNPQCPLSLAATLVPRLPRAELREMCDDTRLAEASRKLAERELGRRRS